MVNKHASQFAHRYDSHTHFIADQNNVSLGLSQCRQQRIDMLLNPRCTERGFVFKKQIIEP
ncbi:Uncharacterised protein [Vibrio cholerae]|nr:Uncharacterised protein [Vibrio cholerae]